VSSTKTTLTLFCGSFLSFGSFTSTSTGSCEFRSQTGVAPALSSDTQSTQRTFTSSKKFLELCQDIFPSSLPYSMCVS